jgi:hypothetical protein
VEGGDTMSVEPEDGVLGPRLSVEELVTMYATAEAEIAAALASVSAALDRVNGAFFGANRGYAARLETHSCHHGFDVSPEGTAHALGELRRGVWRSLVQRAGIQRLMSVRAWEDLSKRLEKDAPAPVTAENVRGLLDQFRHDVPTMLEEAVREVFEWLRPPGSCYVTNTEYEIGERVILSGIVSRGFGRSWNTGYGSRDQHLVALENVLHALDGKPRPADGSHYSDVAREIMRIPNGQPCHGATDLVEFRGHKNGNLHLKFRRMDLVKRLNAVAGGARLRPARAA